MHVLREASFLKETMDATKQGVGRTWLPHYQTTVVWIQELSGGHMNLLGCFVGVGWVGGDM